MDPTSQAYISLEAVIGVVSIIGNAFVLLAIYKNYTLRTPTNCFIASLAAADMLVGIIVAPLAALSYLGLPRNFLGCVFTNSCLVMLTQISIFSLAAVAGERFLAIKHPFLYQKRMTMKTAVIINVLTWIFAILIGLIPLFGWNLGYSGDPNWTCSFTNVIDMKYMVCFNFFICVLVPLFVMFGIYTYIFAIVRKQMIQIASLEIPSLKYNGDRHRTSRKLKREIKAAKSLAIVIGLFALCWIPLHVLNTVSLFCGTNCPYPYTLLLTTILLSHANSAINPFLYAYGNSNFKVALKKMLGLKLSVSDIETSMGKNVNSLPKCTDNINSGERNNLETTNNHVNNNKKIYSIQSNVSSRVQVKTW